MPHHVKSSPVQLAVGCTPCTLASRLQVPPFVDVPSSSTPRVAHQPTYCPTCGKPSASKYRPYDYADTLCHDFYGLSRACALELIHLYNQLKAESKDRKLVPVYAPTVPGGQPQLLGHANVLSSRSTVINQTQINNPYDLLTLPKKVGGMELKPVLMRSTITPLTIRCSKCCGTYTLLRSVPSIQQTPPIYCVWCGSPTTTIVQDDTQEVAWLTLAHHHNLSVQALQFFYNEWLTQPHGKYPTLLSFIESPAQAPFVAAARKKLQASQPASQPA